MFILKYATVIITNEAWSNIKKHWFSYTKQFHFKQVKKQNKCDVLKVVLDKLYINE